MGSFRYVLPTSVTWAKRYNRFLPFASFALIIGTVYFYGFVWPYEQIGESDPSVSTWIPVVANLVSPVFMFGWSIFNLREGNELFIASTGNQLSWRLNPYERRRKISLLKIRQIRVGLLQAHITTLGGKRYTIEFGNLPYAGVQEVKVRLEALAVSPQLFNAPAQSSYSKV